MGGEWALPGTVSGNVGSRAGWRDLVDPGDGDRQNAACIFEFVFETLQKN